MKKKILSFVGAFILSAVSVFSFSACSNGNGKIQVSIGMWPDQTLTSDVAMFNTWKENFEADYPQYEIVAAPYTYDPSTIHAKASSRQLPTVFQTYFTEPPMLIKNGYITDVTDLLKEFGWYDKMDEDMRESITVDGKVYGVPRDGYGLGLFLNLSMLYDIGEIDKNADGTYKLHDDNGNPLYPTTFDDIERISQEVVDSFEQGTYGMIILSANRNGGWQFSNIAWNFGCTNLQVYENGKWTAKLNSQSSVNALEWIRNMRLNDLIYPSASLSYNDWHQKIGNKNVAMAICGSDAVSLPVTNENFNLDDIAFVPMPTGDGTSRYSLYGGTPYVFSSSATEEQIRGAMLFLKYMGRSPEVDQVSLDAIELGYKTAVQKGMPVIPSIRPWVNSNYTTAVAEIEAKYVNVNLEYYNDFFNSINTMKKSEEPNNCQDMYNLLDNALQSVLSNASTANSLSLLTTANNQFQSNYLDKIK